MSSSYQILIPSKTFLVGEYAVLHGGSCLIANTLPQFDFRISTKAKKLSHPFHSQSVASLYIEKNKELFSNIKIELSKDLPSGFGLSGAQWNCVYTLSCLLKNQKINSVHQAWEEYKKLSKNTSGADVVAQKTGELCSFCPNPFDVKKLDWNFHQIQFAFILTGETLNTWDHVKDIKSKNCSRLVDITHLSLEAVQNSNEDLFIKSIKEYADELENQKWITKTSYNLLQKINSFSQTMAAKGCGAMGAESIVLFFKKEDKEDLIRTIQKELSPKQSIREGIFSKGVTINTY